MNARSYGLAQTSHCAGKTAEPVGSSTPFACYFSVIKLKDNAGSGGLLDRCDLLLRELCGYTAGSFDRMKARCRMPRFTTIVEAGETVTGIEVDREIRRGIDLLSLIVSNGLAGYADHAPDLVTVQTADSLFHTGPEKK